MPIRTSLDILFRQRRTLPDTMSQARLNQLYKITEEQRNQFENLRYISLLFYVPIVLVLFYFWI